MIVRVARQASKAASEVAVATDDERIRICCEENGIRCVVTSPDHRSGTDRIAEAYSKLGSNADVGDQRAGRRTVHTPRTDKTSDAVLHRKA